MPMVAGLLLVGCGGGPIDWQDPMTLSDEVPAAARLVFDSAGAPTFAVPPAPLIALPVTACSASVSFARLASSRWFAAWWGARADSSLDLVVARSSDDGRTWSVPVVADGRDRSGSGCARPPPFITADSLGGYVHVVYYLAPPGGPGVYFTHSMAMGAEIGEIWHEPVGVVFGTAPVRASVAAIADTVVVAYQSPNDVHRRIAIAISRTAGHIFEERTAVSGTTVGASEPRVALRGRTVAVAWREGAGEAAGPGGGRILVRLGTLRNGK